MGLSVTYSRNMDLAEWKGSTRRKVSEAPVVCLRLMHQRHNFKLEVDKGKSLYWYTQICDEYDMSGSKWMVYEEFDKLVDEFIIDMGLDRVGPML